MTTIPLLDLRIQYRALKPEIDRAIQAVLDRGQFILGPEVEALEREIADYCGTPHAVAVASGTDALELSLRACGIGPGDEVVTTAYSFFASAEAIAVVGAVPIFVDIDPATYTLDHGALSARIGPRTKAILPVHLFGHPCDMDAIQRVARAHGLRIIEDCAQAIGAQYRGGRVGSFGDAGALSFFPSKNLGAYGDGGMVVTHDAVLAGKIRLLRTHGGQGLSGFSMVGTNSRLDELQAAILRVKLRHLDAWNTARRERAQWYAERFASRRVDGLILPVEQTACRHVYHLFTIRTPKRDQVKAALARCGIASQVYYPETLPPQPALAPYRQDPSSFPQAEAATRECLSLPLYPELSSEALDRIVDEVARAAAD